MILRRISLLVNACEEPEYVAPIANSITYNGNSQELLTAGSTNDGTIYYSIDNSTWDVNIPSGTNADSYTVYWKLVGDEGYCDVESRIINVTIEKADTTYAAPTAKSLTYNGSVQVLLNAGEVTGGTIQYSDDNTTWGTSIPTGTNANTYTSYWRIVGDSNHNDKVSASINTTIEKLTPTVVAPTAKVLTYNGSAQELVNAGSTDYGTLQYKVGDDDWSTNIPTRTHGGSYEVKYRVVGDSNIYDVAPQNIQCSINEKEVTATVTLSQTAYTYNGSTCEPSVTVSDGGVIIDPSEYTVTYSNNINVGTATVTISDNVGGDYEIIGSATFTINKANPAYIAPTVKNLAYNGSAQELLNPGSTNDGTIQYSSDNTNWSTLIPSQTNVGTYTSYWRILGDNNHNDKASDNIVTTISKADSSLSFSISNFVVGVGESTTNIVTVNAGDGNVTYESSNPSIVTVDNNGSITGNSAGNVTITANIGSTSNYNSASTSYTSSCLELVIAKFNVTSTSIPTKILSSKTNVDKVYIDGVERPSVVSAYTFGTVGEHTVKYKLIDPTAISDSTFTNCKNLTNIVIPDSVTSIGEKAFQSCSSLTSINIPSGVTSIGDYAFSSCVKLTSIVIPDSVTSIAYMTFHYCTGLTSCTIGSGVTSIGDNAFYNCSGMTTCTIGSGVTSIGDEVFRECSSLTSIDIPDSVTSIGISAFTYCYNLTSCTIGSGVTSIGDYAFNHCSSLTSINIPSGVTSIGNSVFNNCESLTSIGIPDSVTSIGSSAFEECRSLTSIEIPSGVTTIGDRAFRYCESLSSINIPDSVTSIGNSPFAWCGSLPVINCIQYADTYAITVMQSCQDDNQIVIKNGTRFIGSGAFGDCRRLASIEIPDSVEVIGNSVFDYCLSLTSVKMGSGVRSIGEHIFANCSSLVSITCNAMTAPTIQNTTFQYTKEDGTLKVPIGSTGYDVWMSTDDYYLGKSNWTKVEQ